MERLTLHRRMDVSVLIWNEENSSYPHCQDVIRDLEYWFFNCSGFNEARGRVQVLFPWQPLTAKSQRGAWVLWDVW